MNPRVRPVRVPAIEVRLRRLDRLEAQALQRRPLRVADAPTPPAWKPGDEFESARKRAIAEAK